MEKYVIEKPIGEGAFGKAILVTEKRSKRKYVIKEINMIRMSQKEKDAALKEVSLLASLEHKNIVGFKDSFQERGNLCIVMDYCAGGDLHSRINARRGMLFKEDQILDWFVQMCLSIKHIHDRKILHRDIKSQNIFLTSSGVVKLGDFGIARVLNNTVDLARTQIGTPYYLSPEICENAPYNSKSDIWSLACVLYEMSSLKHAFEGRHMKALINQICRAAYNPLPNRYSYDLRNLIAQMFRRSPRERPSINSILRKNFIHKRVKKFLTDDEIASQFGHTVLHGERLDMKNPFGAKRAREKEPAKRPPSQDRPLSARSARNAQLAYGGAVCAKQIRPNVDKAKAEKENCPVVKDNTMSKNRMAYRKKQEEIEARRKAERERNWKQLDVVADSPAQAFKLANAALPKNGGPAQQIMRARGDYQQYRDAINMKIGDPLDNLGEERRKALNARGLGPAAPLPNWPGGDAVRNQLDRAWRAKQAAEIDRIQQQQVKERARLAAEYRERQRAAAENKKRAEQQIYGRNGSRPNSRQEVANQQKDYLEKLRQIRQENFLRRRAEAMKVNNGRPPSADPRFDPEARKQKLEALKAQAEERAAFLRAEMERNKQNFDANLKRAQPKGGKDVAAVPAGFPIRRAVPVSTPEPAKPPAMTNVLQKIGVAPPISTNQQPNIANAAPGLTNVMNKIGIIDKPKSSDKLEPVNQKISAAPETKWNPEAAAVNLGALPIAETTACVNENAVNNKWQNRDLPHALDNLPLEVSSSQSIAEADAPLRKEWGRGDTVVKLLGDASVSLQQTGVANLDSLHATESTLNCDTKQSPSSPQKSPVGYTITFKKDKSPKGKEHMRIDPITEETTDEKGSKPELKDDVSPVIRSDTFSLDQPKNASTIKAEEGKVSILKSAPNDADQIETTLRNDRNDDANITDLKSSLKEGQFDTSTEVLRTCSLPELDKLFDSDISKNKFFNVSSSLGNELNVSNVEADENEINNDEATSPEKELFETAQMISAYQQELSQLDATDEDDENAADHDDDNKKPLSSSKAKTDCDGYSTIRPNKAECSPDNQGNKSETYSEESDDDVEDNVSNSSEFGDDGSDDDVFSRLEEMRAELEDELGEEEFHNVYKIIEAANEEEGVGADEVYERAANLLGEKQKHLYPRILKLVIADSAYEQNV